MSTLENSTARSHVIEQLTAGALRAIRSTLPQLWPVLLAMTALSGLNLYVQERFTLLAAGPDGPTVVSAAYDLAVGALNALLGAIALRVLLGRGERAWRVDRGLAVYTGLIVASGVASELLVFLLPDAAMATTHPEEFWSRMTTGVVLMFALWRSFLSLILWPIGELMDEPVTPVRSYFAMKGMIWRCVAATLLLIAPALTLIVLIKMGVGSRFPTATLMLNAPVYGFMSIAIVGVSAEVYRLLIGQAVDQAATA